MTIALPSRNSPRTLSIKRQAQLAINALGITSLAELCTYVLHREWTITRFGKCFVSVQIDGGQRFRLFLADHARAAQSGQSTSRGIYYDFWIYALVAHSPAQHACYIGQTRHLRRRMTEHWKRRSGGRASSSLFDWAAERNIPVNVVILQAISGTQADAITAEASWLASALKAGYDAPRIEIWRPNHRGNALHHILWPSESVISYGLPIEKILGEDSFHLLTTFPFPLGGTLQTPPESGSVTGE